MTKQLLPILIFLIVFLIPLSLASTDYGLCEKQYCQGQNNSIYNYFLSSGDNSNYVAVNYSKCLIGASLYPIVSGDLVNGTSSLYSTDFLTATTTTFAAYNGLCEKTIEGTFPNVITNIVLSDYDNDGYSELMYANTSMFFIANISNGTLQIEHNISFNMTETAGAIMDCSNQKCYILDASGSKIRIIYFSNLSNATIAFPLNSGSYSSSYYGYGQLLVDGSDAYICFAHNSANFPINCYLYKNDVQYKNFTIDTAAGLRPVTYYQIAKVRFGGSYRVLFNLNFTDGNTLAYVAIYDENLNLIKLIQDPIYSYGTYSEFMVSDFEYRGVNSIGLFHKNGSDTKFVTFRYTDGLQEINTSVSFSFTRFNSISSFDKLKSYQYFFNYLGIQYLNESIIYSINNDTTYQYRPITLVPTSKNVYSFYDNLTYLGDGFFTGAAVAFPSYSAVTASMLFSPLSTTFSGAVCGDGVCDIDNFETGYTCPQDCSSNASSSSGLLSSGEVCSVNEDCDSNYCYGTICRLRTTSMTCTANSQCVSGSCSNGICTKAPLWTGIDSATKEEFGDDSNTLMFISIIIILVICGLTIYGAVNAGQPMAGIFLAVCEFFVLIIFFTIVGWLSAWILLFMIIIAIIVGFIMWMASSGTD